MDESNSGFDVIYRGRKGRIEVETPGAMFEFDITPDGLANGDTFANSSFDLRNVPPAHKVIARRLAAGWLRQARENNPAI